MKRAALTDDIFKTGRPEPEKQEPPEATSPPAPPASQRMHTSAGMPALRPSPEPAAIKKTYYFDHETLAILERERYKRRAAGQRVGSDFSALIREAVKKSFG